VRLAAALVLLPLAVMQLAAGCTSERDGDTARSSDDELGGDLHVLVAASLLPVAEVLAGEFELLHPGLDVQIAGAGSSALREQVLAGAPAQYARSYLYTETDDNDLTYFLAHQLEVMLRAIANVESYLAAKTKQVRQVEETLKRTTDLNQRQLALLAHALRHPNAEYTIRSHMTSHSVAYATARADLFRLADLGLLERRRVGRRSYLFFPRTDLHDRVRMAD